MHNSYCWWFLTFFILSTSILGFNKCFKNGCQALMLVSLSFKIKLCIRELSNKTFLIFSLIQFFTSPMPLKTNRAQSVLFVGLLKFIRIILILPISWTVKAGRLLEHTISSELLWLYHIKKAKISSCSIRLWKYFYNRVDIIGKRNSCNFRGFLEYGHWLEYTKYS